MWWSHDHSIFSNHRLNLSENVVGKKLIVVFAAHIRFVLWLVSLLYFGHAAETLRAQMAASRPPAAVDFDQTIGMPPYVFRTYQFAAAEPGKVRVEVYLGMVNDILQFVKMAPDTGAKIRYRAQYEVNVTVWDKQKNPLDSRNWKRERVVDHFDDTNDRKKLNIERAAFDLPPGEYEIALEITDRDTGKNLRERRPLKLNAVAGLQLNLSSIVLTQPAPVESISPRDSLLNHFAPIVLSKTSKRSGAAYFEIYGAQAGETLQLNYQILDWRRQALQEWSETLTVSQTPVRHLVDFTGKINQAGLHTFHLVVKRSTGDKAKEAAAEEGFHVQISADQDYAAALAENKNLLYQPLRYIVKGADYKQIIEADEATRDSLVAAFWRQRDPEPAASRNQLREEFYRRVAFAQMRFAVAGSGKAGWETDRGRIYIKYGPPREVHHQFAEQGATPYEIWLYPDLDLHFIFRDKTGAGDFELVHR
ncbi:MAG: GWxTD domain-containing protein [candidate division KSB1 bacterium]|nr:GWxTD domain-containing protein [candidate division KSB1 bacterium]MDZ7368610.1 GWxTD domain-containing protein [candidate division KSB1 bacterium]MDZ7406354.1 GWxTD domain-containing protein [candidate division KSB1 bacterium]